MKAEGTSISFYPGTKTLNVQGSKSEIISQKLLQFASTDSEEQSHFAASNTQTNFVSDDDNEQQEGFEGVVFGRDYRGLECSYQMCQGHRSRNSRVQTRGWQTAFEIR